jgi:hypothetical protein
MTWYNSVASLVSLARRAALSVTGMHGPQPIVLTGHSPRAPRHVSKLPQPPIPLQAECKRLHILLSHYSLSHDGVTQRRRQCQAPRWCVQTCQAACSSCTIFSRAVVCLTCASRGPAWCGASWWTGRSPWGSLLAPPLRGGSNWMAAAADDVKGISPDTAGWIRASILNVPPQWASSTHWSWHCRNSWVVVEVAN